MRMTRTQFKKINGEWVEEGRRISESSLNKMNELKNSMKFFKDLRGNEKFEGNKLISISPNGETKIERLFHR